MCEKTLLINTEGSQETNHAVAVYLQHSLAIVFFPKLKNLLISVLGESGSKPKTPKGQLWLYWRAIASE